MKILHATSELFPLVKTGGLADVLGALPYAQNQNGDDVRVVIPYYHAIKQKISPELAPEIARCNTFYGDIGVRLAVWNGLKIYLIDAPHLYDREGNIYYDQWYRDYGDNLYRFAILSWTAAAIATGLDPEWGRVDMVHCHDWQAGLTPAYLLNWGANIRSVMTIHNIAYQGVFYGDARGMLASVWLPDWMMQSNGLEFNGNLSFLKAGLYYADAITTVSPTYAHEITQWPNGYGMEGLLNTRRDEGRLYGILNGVDPEAWNPEKDQYIQHKFSINNLNGKAAAKKALLERFNLATDRNVPLLVVVSRLAQQKGMDLLAQAIEARLNSGYELPFQFILLGSGEGSLENWYRYLAQRDSRNIALWTGYNEALAHEMIAAADSILIPSRFEPCGLTQLYGLKYGALPLVRRTGGLADTVVEASQANLDNKTATGFVFNDANEPAVNWAIQSLVELWADQTKWAEVRKTAMEQDFGWKKAAKNYRQVYDKLLDMIVASANQNVENAKLAIKNAEQYLKDAQEWAKYAAEYVEKAKKAETKKK